jgi:hypothetical protein
VLTSNACTKRATKPAALGQPSAATRYEVLQNYLLSDAAAAVTLRDCVTTNSYSI